MATNTNIRVSARLRPLPNGRAGDECFKYVEAQKGKRPGRHIIQERNTQNGFPFDDVYDQGCKNVEVFTKIGTRIVRRLADGYNATVFMYGQTGSGKTHTMLGDEGEPGLLPLTCQHIFKVAKEMASKRSFLLRCRYVEIYNENVFDLLNSRKKLQLTLKADGESFETNSKAVFVRSFEDLQKYLRIGAQTKKMGVSNINEHSSRSHTIFSLVMESQEEEEDERSVAQGGQAAAEKSDEKQSTPVSPSAALPAPQVPAGQGSGASNVVVRVSTMNLVDLAGSESFSTKFGHSQQQETKAINKSLSALKSVVIALSKNEKFIPYRNSALTRMLKSSLGGNAETDIIITLHNGADQLKQSKYTIEFGSLANKIVCKVHENVASNDDKVLIRKYKSELQKLAAKLKAAEELAREKEKIDTELGQLAEMQRNMICSPRFASDHLDRINALEGQLREEKLGRLKALDTASSRDSYLAKTMQEHERQMEERMTMLRIELEQEREQMRLERDMERQAMNMERMELRQVVAHRREIENLKIELEHERQEKGRLVQALDNAEHTVMELTLQMTAVSSQMQQHQVKRE